MRGEESAFRRWMRFEMDAIHAGLVTQRRLLADLLAEPEPGAPARQGRHAFDPLELRRMAEALPTELRYTLRLPVHLYLDSSVEDAAYVHDRAAAGALPLLGVATRGRPDPQGRMWLGRALALRAVRDWPTTMQLVYL